VLYTLCAVHCQYCVHCVLCTLCCTACAQEMLSVLTELSADTSLGHDDCFALCLMSHGQLRTLPVSSSDSSQTVECECLLGSDCAAVPTSCLLAPFSNDRCPSLRGKPRIVIFQACRGGMCLLPPSLKSF